MSIEIIERFKFFLFCIHKREVMRFIQFDLIGLKLSSSEHKFTRNTRIEREEWEETTQKQTTMKKNKKK